MLKQHVIFRLEEPYPSSKHGTYFVHVRSPAAMSNCRTVLDTDHTAVAVGYALRDCHPDVLLLMMNWDVTSQHEKACKG